MATAVSQHKNAFLTNTSVKYSIQRDDLIASRAVPPLKVQKKNDAILTFDQEFWFRNNAVLIPEGDPVPRKSYGTSEVSYITRKYGLGSQITEEEAANSDNIHMLQMNRTEFVTDAVLLRDEIEAAAILFDETGFASQLTAVGAGTGWGGSSATPIQNLLAMKNSCRSQMGGRMPNTWVFGNTPWEDLLTSDEAVKFLYGLGSNSMLKVTEAKLAEFLGAKQVLIGRQGYNSAAEGATVVTADIWGDYVWCGWTNLSPAVNTASSSYRIESDYGVRKWNEIATKNTVIEATRTAVATLISAPAGHLLKSVHSGA